MLTLNSTYTGNSEIAPAVEDADDNGWHKDAVWTALAADSCGDYAVGAAFESRYWKANADGTFAVVTETYYVEQIETSNQPVVEPALAVLGRYEFLVCRSLEDVGGTEVWSDTEYDDGVDVRFWFDLADAEQKCREVALSDQRFTLTWDGLPR